MSGHRVATTTIFMENFFAGVIYVGHLVAVTKHLLQQQNKQLVLLHRVGFAVFPMRCPWIENIFAGVIPVLNLVAVMNRLLLPNNISPNHDPF